MKKVKWILIIFLLFSIPCFADRSVVIEKSSGKLIMSQSKPGPGAIEAMESDVLSLGGVISDYDIRVISDSEWAQIEYDKITKPTKDKQEQEKAEKKVKEDELKSELGWTNAQLNKMKKIFK